MDENAVLKLLVGINALVTGSHVVYASGKHGSDYVNKDAIYPHVWETSRICRQLAKLFVDECVEVVLAPAVGGIVLSQWTAYHLETFQEGRQVLAVYADKTEDGGFVLRRGYDKLVAGRRVLMIEDVLTTGGSVRKTIEATRAANGEVIGLGAICNRGNVTATDVGVPMLRALVNLPLDAWNESDCPLCEQGIPINAEVGKGLEYLERRKRSH